MTSTIKKGLVSLLVISGGLILLKNNILAAGVPTSSAPAISTNQAAQVEALQTQTKQLTQEVQNYLAQQSIPATTSTTVADNKKVLTQKELDDIEAQVKVIAAKTEVIKTEVAKIVLMHQISAKIAYLQTEVNALQSAKTTAPATQTPLSNATSTITITPQPSESANTNQEKLETQINTIKDKIKDLTTQYEQQKAAEETNQEANIAEPEIECEGESCSANITINPSQTVPANNPPQKTNSGFWNSLGNFLKNLFTF